MRIFALVTILLISFAASADLVDPSTQTKTPADDKVKLEEYNLNCQLIDQLLVRKAFHVECNSNYQIFGPTSRVSKSEGQIKIAGYNLLHPGTSKALFKDYNLVAKIMNQYDVVSGLELLSSVGHDEENNRAVVDFLRKSPKLMSDLKALEAKTTEAKKLAEIKAKMSKLDKDTKAAYNLYRAPGYFKVLINLKRLDPSWSLILSPRGDSALQGSVEELVGYFYRANTVSPTTNPHCSETKDSNGGTPYACFIDLTSRFMGKNFVHHFARRPFMASFRSGSMKFSLVSSHVVFTYSGDEDQAKTLMNEVFNVDAPSDLGGGINMSNFARFAEVKTTLDFIARYKKKYGDKNIMYVADTNLTASNAFWPSVLNSVPGSSLLIDEPTTISPPRYAGDGRETNGVANSYDHFVLDKSVFSNCSNGEVYNYYKSGIENDIRKIYTIREGNALHIVPKGLNLPLDDGHLGDIPPEDDQLPTKLDYPLTSSGQLKMNKKIAEYTAFQDSQFTIKKNAVAQDDFQYQERIDSFKRRVFLNQLTNAFYYRFYQEILSDHFPVSITCKL